MRCVKLLLPLFCVACLASSSSDGLKFPANFVFGAATSAFQIEGAWNDSRVPSIWDTFSKIPGKIHNDENADVACDFYHKYKEDIPLLRQAGLNALRLSISWPRLVHTVDGPADPVAVAYYNDVFDTLLASGITPYVTLFHWDLPQYLEDQGGWLQSTTIDQFVHFARLCFDNFGSKVKTWFTINEPRTFALAGYQQGRYAPGRCSQNCTLGNSSSEPYMVGHNLLLAHAHVVNAYRTNYTRQSGSIGIVLDTEWFEALPGENRTAADRALTFSLGWFADPVFKGDYPEIMKQLLGERLPAFSVDEKALLTKSADFFGLNFYTSSYAELIDCPAAPTFDIWTDACISKSFEDKNQNKIGIPTPANWIYVTPAGLQKILVYIYSQYNNPSIYVTECGIPDDTSQGPIVKDSARQNFYNSYLQNLVQATYSSASVKGFFMWSLLDNFEWTEGYSQGFGLVSVKFADLSRTPKESTAWLKGYIDAHSTASTKSDYPFEVLLTVGVALALVAVVGLMLSRWLRGSNAESQPLI